METTQNKIQVESVGIDYIPESERKGEPKSLIGMWWGGQFTYISLVIGALPIIIGLPLWQAVLAVLIGGFLGCIFVGLSSIVGPSTGTATIINTRAPLGIRGNVVPEIFNWITCIGWAICNSILAALALYQLGTMIGITGPVAKAVAAIIVVGVQMIITSVGYDTVLKSEKIFAIISTVLIIGLLIFVFPNIDFQINTGAGNGVTFGLFVLGVTLVFVGPMSWVNYASDYTRYFSEKTDRKKIVLCAGGGMLVATFISYTIGTLLAAAVDMNDPIANLPNIIPTWYLAPFLFVVCWSCIANNVLNVYTAGLGLLALRVKVKRSVSTIIISILTLIACFIALFFYDFVSMFESFLNVQILWLAPWCVLLISDYVRRKGKYQPLDLHKVGEGAYWYKNGFNVKNILLFAIAIAVAIVFYSTPVTNALGGADISAYVSMLVMAILYMKLGDVK